MQNEHPRHWLDYLTSIGNFTALAAIPVVLAVIGHWSSEAIKSQETAVRYTELALDILASPEKESGRGMREWATRIISKHSGFKIDYEEAVANAPWRTYVYSRSVDYDKDAINELATTAAREIVQGERWRAFITNPGNRLKQSEYLRDLLAQHHEEVQRKRSNAKVTVRDHRKN